MTDLVSPAGTAVSVGDEALESRLLQLGWKPAGEENPEPEKPKRGRPRKTT